MTSDKKSRIGYKKLLGYMLSLLLAAVLLWAAFKGANIKEVINILSGVSYIWIAAFLICTLLAHLIRAYRWKIILNSVKKDISIGNLFGALMVGYGVNTVVPRLGEVARAVTIAKWENLSRSSMFGAVIVERVIDMIALSIAVLISVFIWSENLYDQLPWLASALYIMAGLIIAGIAGLIIAVNAKERFIKIINKVFGSFSEKAAERISGIFNLLAEGFGSLKGAINYFNTIWLTAVLSIVYALGSYIAFYIFNLQDNSYVSFGTAWILYSISSFGIIIPTPGGAGSYHAIVKSILVILFSFNEEVSVAYAFLTNFLSNMTAVAGGVICYFYFNNRADKRRHTESKETLFGAILGNSEK